MARVTGPTDTGSLAPALRGQFYTASIRGRTYANKPPPPQPISAEQLAAYLAALEAARTSWAALSVWKRARWTICAMRHGLPADDALGFIGWGGLTLYQKMWFDQSIISPHQPTSPCARRITDPGASPWDYTP